MRLALCLISFVFSLSLFAECRMRIELDRAYSKKIGEALELEAKDKKFQVMRSGDDRWEEFRLFVGAEPLTESSGKTGERVSVTLKKFVAPQFKTVFHKAVILENGDRDLLLRDQLRKLPSCHQALYGEIFASLD